MEIPVMGDDIQAINGNLEVPEIRVWCHPHKVGKSGDDDYYTFSSFQEALDFIRNHPEAEDAPLIAFRGYELHIFEIAPRTN